MSQLSTDLYAIIRCAVQFRGEKTAPLGLKSCHISYLSRICCYPGISQDQLAQMILAMYRMLLAGKSISEIRRAADQVKHDALPSKP